jgi:hypothetical protein
MTAQTISIVSMGGFGRKTCQVLLMYYLLLFFFCDAVFSGMQGINLHHVCSRFNIRKQVGSQATAIMVTTRRATTVPLLQRYYVF